MENTIPMHNIQFRLNATNNTLSYLKYVPRSLFFFILWELHQNEFPEVVAGQNVLIGTTVLKKPEEQFRCKKDSSLLDFNPRLNIAGAASEASPPVAPIVVFEHV